MREDFILDESVSDLAEKMGSTYQILSEYFRVVKHRRFTTWRKELRIKKAQKLLIQDPHLSIATIREMVGINDKSNFRKQFKEISGLSPKEWRIKHGITDDPSED